jgi:hypothetical protein
VSVWKSAAMIGPEYSLVLIPRQNHERRSNITQNREKHFIARPVDPFEVQFSMDGCPEWGHAMARKAFEDLS